MIQFVYALGTKVRLAAQTARFFAVTHWLGAQAGDTKYAYHVFSVLHGIIMLGVVIALFFYLVETASTELVFLIGTAGVASYVWEGLLCHGSAAAYSVHGSRYAAVSVLYGETCFIMSNAIQCPSASCRAWATLLSLIASVFHFGSHRFYRHLHGAHAHERHHGVLVLQHS